MSRNARCVVPGVAHHVTQRGVARGDVFFEDTDRQTYLHLVVDQLRDADVRVLAWCLMTNHVHWVVVPAQADSLAILFRRVHGRYAQYLNARLRRTGHLWQNRFYSCAVAQEREASALRYVEQNPLRAGMVGSAGEYEWSSARAHLAGPGSEKFALLDWNDWERRGGGSEWRSMIAEPEDAKRAQELRRATYAGAPLGSAEFVGGLEKEFGRQWRKVGRPRQAEGAGD